MLTSPRSRMVTPPIFMRALSPPPMRRARPPARIRPRVYGCEPTSSLPPCGGGLEWGVVPYCASVPHRTTPTPDPSPQGEGGKKDVAPSLIMHRGLAPVL